MPRKSLQGRTCGVSCDGGRARTPQQTHSVEGAARTPTRKSVGCFIQNHAHPLSRLVLARPPSRDTPQVRPCRLLRGI
ncbi:hypothetical protein XaraCFBP7407_22700, partial [Xanthomonas arboricola pv. arracaciae]